MKRRRAVRLLLLGPIASALRLPGGGVTRRDLARVVGVGVGVSVGGACAVPAALGVSDSAGQQQPKGPPPPRQQDLTAIGLQTPATTPKDAPFVELATGVKVQTLKSGVEGGDAVAPSSTVFLEATGRFLNLNGVKFYSTLDAADASALGGPEPIRVTLGTGDLLPGIEDGILGAKRNEIRRIIVPASRGYDLDVSYEPKPTGLGLNALNSVLRNPRRDGTMLFDVKIVRIK